MKDEENRDHLDEIMGNAILSFDAVSRRQCYPCQTYREPGLDDPTRRKPGLDEQSGNKSCIKNTE